MRPWRSRTLLATVFVVLVTAAAMSAAFVSVPPRASAAPGPAPLAVGPRHELAIGVEELTVQTTNPLQATLVDEFIMWIGVYSFLFNIDAGLSYEPDVAVRWAQTNADPVTYRFELTKNAYFIDPRTCTKDAQGHHNACDLSHPVTAADVKFSWDYVKQYAGQTALMSSCVEHFALATIIDPYTITIAFDGPYAPVLSALGCVPILPQYIWTGRLPDDANALPIGSGPYMVRPDPANTARMLTPPPLIMDRNPFWHGREVVGRQVYPDTVQYISYTTSGAMSVDLTLGKLDHIVTPSSQDWLGFLAANSAIWRQAVPGGFIGEQAVQVLADDIRANLETSRQLFLGETNPLLRDYQVIRDVIHMATDRQRVIDEAYGGLATPADTMIPPYNAWYYNYPDFVGPDYDAPDGNPDTVNEEFIDFQPDAATIGRQMLHAAGWLYDCAGNLDTGTAVPLCRLNQQGQAVDDLSFLFSTFNTDPSWEAAARVVVQNAAAAGIQLNLELVGISQMNSKWYQLDYEVWLWDWIFGALTDPALLIVVQTCQGIDTLDNDNGFCPRDADGTWIFDEVYNQTLTETDPVARRVLTDYLLRWVYEFASYNIPFYLNELYAGNSLHYTNWGDWTDLIALATVSGNPPLIGQYPYPVDQKPPQFNLPEFEGIAGSPVQFSVAAVDPEGGPLTYRWDFDASGEPSGAGVNGDSIWNNDNQASIANPTFTYSAVGTYTATLRVSEDGGDFFTVKSTTVRINPAGVGSPEISAVTFGPSDPTLTDPDVDFAASASDPAGLAIQFSWNFGDGSPATAYSSSPLASHTYGAAGTYTVALSVRNSAAAISTSQTIVQVVANVAPTVASLESKAVIEDQAETFVAYASDANSRDVLSYSWTFGDGTPAQTGNPVTHTYATQVGSPFTLTVQVNDGHGHTTTQTASISVVGDRNRAPTIQSLTASTAQTYVNVPVMYTGTARDPDGNGLLWQWDFNNDGTVDRQYTSELTPPGQDVVREETTSYATPSSGAGYRARLTITDIPPVGQTPRTTSTTVTVRILANAAPTLSALSTSPAAGIAGQDFTFSATSADSDGDRLDWMFDFGDGTSASGQTNFFGGSISATHAFDASGDFLVALTVDDGKGASDASATLVTVSEPALLRVTTNPAVPGKIFIDGYPADEWGTIWVKVSPGSHTVSFGDLYGLGTPAAVPVTTVAGATTEVQGNYAVYGSLRVLTNPAVAGTIYVDGQPANDWGMWRAVPAGTYTISFGAVADYTPPASVQAVVTAGGYTEVTGQYTLSPGAPGPDPATYGFLRVTTNPAVPAQILVNGIPRDEWGLTWVKMAPGTYTISFKGVYGVTPPAPADVVVAAGQTTEYQGNFQVHGSLRVITDPAVPGTIFVDGLPRDDWGMWQSMLPGSYKVSYGPVAGFVTPAPETVAVAAGALTFVTGQYVAAAAAAAEGKSFSAASIASLQAVLADLADGTLDSLALGYDGGGMEQMAVGARGTASRMLRARDV
jgi:ABC-type transport system substrate-binding protein/PKD repeat protein